MIEAGAASLTDSRVREIVLRPNRSFSERGMNLLLAGAGVFAVTFAALFIAAGAWPVAPFVGAEFLVVALLVRFLRRHRDDREIIAVTDETLRIVRHAGRHASASEWPRYWCRIEVVGREEQAPRVYVRMRAERVEIGAAVGRKERLAVAAALRRALGPDGSSELRLAPPRGTDAGLRA